MTIFGDSADVKANRKRKSTATDIEEADRAFAELEVREMKVSLDQKMVMRLRFLAVSILVFLGMLAKN